MTKTRIALAALLFAALGALAFWCRDSWLLVSEPTLDDPSVYARDSGTPLLQQHYGPHAHDGE